MATDTELVERVAVLEKDIDVTKGTIKKLVMDIRESMNTMENPFFALQEGVNVIPQKTEEAETEEVKKEAPQEAEKPGVSTETEIEPVIIDETVAPAPVNKPPAVQMPADIHEFAQIPEEIIHEKPDERIDLPVFIKLIKWTEQMHRKLNHEQFKEMLEAFELAGYLPEKIKKLLTSISVFNEDMSVHNDVVIDLYRLNKILNTEDKEMDSTVLSMILNSENDEKEAWLKLMEQDKSDK
jgi:hypothetical protein